MRETRKPQDVLVVVTDTAGNKMELHVPWEDDLEEWTDHIVRIMTFLGYSVDEVEFNPVTDLAEGDKND